MCGEAGSFHLPNLFDSELGIDYNTFIFVNLITDGQRHLFSHECKKGPIKLLINLFVCDERAKYDLAPTISGTFKMTQMRTTHGT